MKQTESKLLDWTGTPIQKAIDSRQMLGVDMGSNYDSWNKQRNPDRSRLIGEYKSTAYACANLNTQAVLKTNLRLYRRIKVGEKNRWPSKSLTYSEQKRVQNSPYQKIRLSDRERIEEITDHPLLDLLNYPNKSVDLVGLMEFTQLFQEICGAGYWYCVRNGLGTPFEIYLLCPQYVKTHKDSAGHIVGYSYGRGTNKIDYTPEEIIPFLLPNPSNPWFDGFSPLQAVYENLNIENKLAATTAAILDNEGRPDGILTAKDGIAPDEATRWEYKFNQKFRRAGNGGVVVLDEDATFTPLTFSPRDLSWLAIHDTTRLAICTSYGVPYALLDKGSSTQYNVDVTIRQRHVEDAVVPRLRRNQSVLNRFLVPMFDDSGKLFLAFDDASPTNRELKLKEDDVLVKAGIVTSNEVRITRGYEPHPDGDRLAIPAGASLAEPVGDITAPATPQPQQEKCVSGQQIGSAMTIVQAVAAGTLPRDSGLGALQVLLNLSLEQATQILGSVGLTFATPTSETPAKGCGCGKCVTKTKGHKKKLPSGKELAKVLKAFFAEQGKDVLKSLQKSKELAQHKGIKAALPSKFIHLEQWDRELYKRSQPLVELYFTDQYKQRGKDYVARTGISPDVFNVTNPNVQETVKGLALSFCKETNATTTLELNTALDKLREEFDEGLVEGDRMSDLVKRVESVFDRADSERAEIIAQSEASRSHHEAQLQAAKDSGVVSGTRILPSTAACELCLSIAEEGEVALGESFYQDKGAPEAYQNKFSPPLHPGCQCALEEVLIETPSSEEGGE